MKQLKETESLDPFLFIFVTLVSSTLGLVCAFPFLLLFAFIMEKLYILDFLRNKWLYFIYGGNVGIFALWLFTVQKIWFFTPKYDTYSFRLFIILFFIHAVTSLFVYRNEQPASSA